MKIPFYIIKHRPRVFLLLVTLSVLNIGLISAQTLTVATAANFRDPMKEIAAEFMKENPSVTVKPIFGSSGSLYQQLSNNAPFDIFFSANMKYPQALFDDSLCYTSPKVYAIGQLVLWSKSIDVSSLGMAVLTSDVVRKIAYANPSLAPYGKGAIEALKSANIYEKVVSKLVKAENIAQTAQFAVTGNTEVGIIAKSQLLMPAIKDKGYWYQIATDSYLPIKQGCVAIKREGNSTLVHLFLAYMTSPTALKIIDKYGYGLE